MAHRRTTFAAGFALGALLLVAGACAGDDGDGSGGGTSRTTPAPAASPTTSSETAPTDPLLVATDLGEVRGVMSAVGGVRVFHALPYAAEPSGDNRWRPPQPRAPYDGTLDATEPGASCPQAGGDRTTEFTPIPEPSEDCLTVSVWSPEDADGLPVMAFFHGGGLRGGSGQQPMVIGDDLAAEGAVVVTVNYRLGPLGWLATEALAAESDDGAVGNYGLLDQIAALEWVQRNIAGFGGDRANVTVFGQSAGGYAVCGLLTSPAADGLLDRAVLQSAAQLYGAGDLTRAPLGRIGACERLGDREEMLSVGAEFLEEAECADMACLRSLPTEDVQAIATPVNLVADGVVLTESAQDAAARGALDDVPVMIGSNATEATLFTIGMPEPTDDEMLALLGEVTDRPEELLALYRAGDFPTNLDRYRAVLTDVQFTCPTIAFAEASTGPTFAYHLAYPFPDDPLGVGPTHGAELIPLFAHPEGVVGLPPEITNPADLELSDAMQAAWTRFARTGDPGDGWAVYADGQQVTLLDDPVELVDEIAGGRCPTVTELTAGR